MNNQNRGRGRNNGNNGNNQFNNPYHLDPNREDISIERKLDKDMFCPFTSLSSNFGLQSDYYSMRTVNPLNESFFYTIESLIFPNATLFQISSILCYVITIIFVITLLFGIDDTNRNKFLPIKMSTADIGSFYPTKIKQNFFQYYRLFTFHFIHFNFTHLFFNIISLVSFCSFFELLIKKYAYLLILFLTGITCNLTSIAIFGENERYCGLNSGIFGILGAFAMFFIMNWGDLIPMFGQVGRFLTAYLVSVYMFISFVFFHLNEYGNILVQLLSLLYGGLIFSIFVKPIKVMRWKTILRVLSVIIICSFMIISLIKFYLK
jgi:rhomboid protease GluP